MKAAIHLASATRLLLGVMALGVIGCEGQQSSESVAVVDEHQPTHIDSIFPIEEEVRRFRATIGNSVGALVGGASARTELVDRFLEALARSDRVALGELAMTVEEFAYLYYPHTQYTRRPYEMSPALLWFQLENHGSSGLQRALRRYGGRPLDARGHACSEEPAIEGPNRIWRNCVVRVVEPGGAARDVSLFGMILERDGRFKFINYGNRL